MPHSKHIKGDRAELIAAEYFIGLGYSVARNMSQHGPVDLVLIDEDGTGDVILVDVKAISLRTKNGYKVNRSPTKKQKELDESYQQSKRNKKERTTSEKLQEELEPIPPCPMSDE